MKRENKDHDRVRRDRADPVPNRALSEEQQQVIRLMVTFPNDSIQAIADRIGKSRSVVSRWRGDPLFAEKLEAARKERPPLSADTIITAMQGMDAEEKRKVLAELGGNGGSAVPMIERMGEKELRALRKVILSSIGERDHRELMLGLFSELCHAGSKFSYPGFKAGQMVSPRKALDALLDREEGELETRRAEVLWDYRDQHETEHVRGEGHDQGYQEESDELDRTFDEETEEGRRLADAKRDVHDRRREVESSLPGDEEDERAARLRREMHPEEATEEDEGEEPSDL